MIIYKAKKQFDTETGNPSKPRLVESGYICDYTGAIIDPEEDDQKSPIYDVKLSDLGGSEQYWYYDSHPVIELIAKELEVDDFQVQAHLNTSEFHFAHDGHGGDSSLALVTEWVRNQNKEGHLFFECSSLADAFSRARYRVIERLLSQKEITVENLGIEA